MLIYATSRNTGPSYQADPIRLLYLGTSVEEAEKAVGEFVRYQRPKDDFPKSFKHIYSALPDSIDWEMIQWFMADGWWYSIVMFELEDPHVKTNTQKLAEAMTEQIEKQGYLER